MWWVLAWFAALAPCAWADENVAQKHDADTTTVLVVGDSISAAYGMQPEDGWVALLEERVNGRGVRVINASVSGETTSGGLIRLPTLLDHEPGIVVIELGGNDGLRGYPVERIRANLQSLVETVLQAGATPVLVGMEIPPNYGPQYTSAFRNAFRQVAEATGAALVPFFLEGIATMEGLMQDDGIHPAAAAQPLLLDNIWPFLEPLLAGAEME